MAEDRSTVRSRQLGDALRAAMDQAGLNGKRTARILDWSESRISRFLTGKLSVTELEISAMAALFGVTGAERDRLLRLTRESATASWELPEHWRTLIDHQSAAVRVIGFDAVTVPVLVQTADYARSVLARMVTVQPDTVEVHVSGRMTCCQRVLGASHPPQCTLFVHELALRLPVGSPQIMCEQLHHLLRMGARSYISVRVIPAAAGAHAGLAGSFCLMEFAEFGPVVSVEQETAGYFLDEPPAVSAYEKTCTSLGAVALGQNESNQLIGRLAVDLYGPTRRDMAALSANLVSAQERLTETAVIVG
ncbi:MAG TPA: helix-turn-helix transcriptional regulator [Pseudonocardiaceae bacterium]|nr:helix-turn-helix transcriptional regulator [Pseudonocardiaceae bacterium]